jgi:hypothetical protein
MASPVYENSAQIPMMTANPAKPRSRDNARGIGSFGAR